MKRLFRPKNMIWGTVPLIALPLVFGACSAAPANAAVINDGAQARDAIVDYLDGRYDDNVPGQYVSWTEEDLTLSGMLGSATKSYESNGWTLFLWYPVVRPDLTVYDVRLVNSDSGWTWEGTVSANGTVSETSPLQQTTEEESRKMAEDFLKNSPTFKFDGIADTMKLEDTVVLRTPFGWAFTFSFESLHGGYGDRTGQQVLQAITPHISVINVVRGEVVTASLDNQWNMLEQKMNDENSGESARTLAEQFIKSDATFKFDGMDGTLECVEVQYLNFDTSRALAFLRFQSAHAGYGDRTGHMQAEVMTPHDVELTIENGQIVDALMDGKWDMLSQEMIDTPEISVPPVEDGTTSVQVAFTSEEMIKEPITEDVEVILPGSLIVTLESNPSTGYQWQDAIVGDKAVLSEYSRQFVGPQDGMVGAPGKDVWTFKSLKRGTSTLQFQYSRPWAGGEANEWTVELNVTVK